MSFLRQVFVQFLLISAFVPFSFVGIPQAHAADLNLLHEFAGGATDGAQPNGSLIRDGSVLYGMTSVGGDDDLGVIFSINTDGSNMTILHEFAGGANDGANPYGSLIRDGSVLYGVTNGGGDENAGTIFSINTDGSNMTLLHEFAGGANDGAGPQNSLVIGGSVLYGMTTNGGDDNVGTIFSINTNGTGFTLLHEFAGGADDGGEPRGSLLLDGALLYGMNFYGGDNNGGTIFSINTDGSNMTLLHEFSYDAGNGAQPDRSSLIHSGSILYGMTNVSGDDGAGVVFSINKNGTGYTVLHKFDGGSDDGASPQGDLLLIDSTLYGMTPGGGDAGTIFSIDTDGSDYRIVHFFEGGSDDGSQPNGSLISDGSVFYGMTVYGGDSDNGVVFTLTDDGGPSPTPTPTPTPVTQSNNSGTSSSDSSAPSCADTAPLHTPDLFQIDVNNTQARLYFAPVLNADRYYISYGNGQSTIGHGVDFNSGVSTGVLSYTINSLLPNTEYSFVVRGGNGCMPGEWGNTMTVKTRNTIQGGTSFYKNFAARILSVFPRQVTNAGSGSKVLGVTTPSVKSCQDYTVKLGDNLWNIASQNLGSGSKYGEIMQKNNLTTTLLNTGQTLKVGC